MDWRLQGVLLAPPNAEGGSDLTVTLVDQVRLSDGRLLAFPIPNASAMMLNTSKRTFAEAQALLAKDALVRAPRGVVQFHSNADAVDFAEAMALSVFTAYTALECFANEWIPPWYLHDHKDKKGNLLKTLDKEAAERSLQLGVKLSEVLPKVYKVNSPKGLSIWEGFTKLEKVRDRIVHMKDADRQSGGSEQESIWKALLAITSPQQAAKRLIDHFVCGRPYVPDALFENWLPVRPRWHVEWPQEVQNNDG
jgi:hypothetical protein